MEIKEQFKFVSTDTTEIIAALTAGYERIMGAIVRPASPENLFIRWAANFIVAERVNINYTGNQNIPSRASGENLDALAELFFIQSRPPAKPAACTMRFYLSKPQSSAILIPQGVRVTDKQGILVWAVTEDSYVTAGERYVDIAVKCLALGAVGNGYAPGQIDTLVDVFPFYERCVNVTESGGGSDAATDAEFYALMRAGEDAYSDAGAEGGYAYFAKQASTEIADVAGSVTLHPN